MAILGVALGVPFSLLAETSNPSPSKDSSTTAKETTWSGRWQNLENDLDKLFHESVMKLSPSTKPKELLFNSSVHVREKPDAYVVRLFLPKIDESKLNITFEKGILHIACTGTTGGTYEQKIAMPGPVNARFLFEKNQKPLPPKNLRSFLASNVAIHLC